MPTHSKSALHAVGAANNTNVRCRIDLSAVRAYNSASPNGAHIKYPRAVVPTGENGFPAQFDDLFEIPGQCC